MSVGIKDYFYDYKNIKSVGEEYQVVKRGKEFHNTK